MSLQLSPFAFETLLFQGAFTNYLQLKTFKLKIYYMKQVNYITVSGKLRFL